MKRLLVTGGAGFIGANFVNYWLANGECERLVVLDALTYAGSLTSLGAATADPRCRFVRADVCDGALVESLMREEALDCVVHFAAETHVDRSIAEPEAFVRTNVLGTHALLEAALKTWTHNGKVRERVRFHQVSTDEVYGSLSPSDAAFTEDSRYRPSSPYSASKAAGDHLVRAYHRTYGLPVTVGHSCNNYGPFQSPEKLLPRMLVHALHGWSLPVYGAGENVRDWIYVEDHCRAIGRMLTDGRAGETYNVGVGNQRRNIDMVRLLCSAVDKAFAENHQLTTRYPQCPAAGGRPVSSLVAFVADRPGHDHRYAMNTARIREQLSFDPVVSVETGVERTVGWYLDNEVWWRSAYARSGLAAL